MQRMISREKRPNNNNNDDKKGCQGDVNEIIIIISDIWA